MKNPEQWLKERCVPEGPLWDKQPSWKEWIEAIQGEAFNEGYREGLDKCNESTMRVVADFMQKPLAKSHEEGMNWTPIKFMRKTSWESWSQFCFYVFRVWNPKDSSWTGPPRAIKIFGFVIRWRT